MDFEKIEDYSQHVAYYHEGKRLEAHEFPMARALQDGITSEIDHVFYARDQHQGIWLNLAGAPIRNEEAEVVAAVVVIQETAPPSSGHDSHTMPTSMHDPNHLAANSVEPEISRGIQ